MDNTLPEAQLRPLLRLHTAFWERTLEQPIINVDCSSARRTWHVAALPPAWEDKDGLILQPDMLAPERLQPAPIAPLGAPSAWGKVAFNTLFPYHRVPWLAAIMGCALRVSATSRTIWPIPYLPDDWYERDRQGFAPRLEWLDKLIEFETFVRDRYYPGQCIPTLDPTVRGPGDLFVQVLGPEKAYLAFYDHPAEARALLEQLTMLYIHWVQRQLAVMPRLQGGYCNQYGMWCPGTCLRTQEDYAVNLSPRIFREFIAPCSTRVIESFDYQVFHTHSGFPLLAEWVLDIEALKAIDIVLDPYGKPLRELIPLCRRILEKKALVILGPMTEQELDFLASSLPARGLWLDVELVTEEQRAAVWEFDRSAAGSSLRQ